MPIQWGSDTLPKKSSIKWLDSPPTAPPPQPVPQKPSIQWLDEPAPVATPIQPEQPGIVSRAFQSAGQNLVGTATGVIEKMQAGANQDKISAIQRAQALPDDFVEPAQPGIGSMGGYSMPTPGRNKQQILAQAYFDAGITPEQLQALRNQNVALVADADLTAQEREQRAKEQAAIDKAQGYGAIATKTRELGTGALESAVMMAPAVPLALAAAPLGIPAATIAGYTGAIAPAILSTAADSEQRAAEKGISNRGAYVATDVALEAIPSLLIPGGAEKLLAEPAKQAVKTGFKQAMKTLLGETAKEIPEELVTTVGQAMNAQLQGVDPTAASPEKLAQAAFDTTISTIMTMGLVGGKGVGTGAIQSLRGTQPTPPTPPIEPPTPAQAEADAILQASTAPPQPNVPTATPEAAQAPLEPTGKDSLQVEPQSSPPAPAVSPTVSTSTAQNTQTKDDSLSARSEGAGGDLQDAIRQEVAKPVPVPKPSDAFLGTETPAPTPENPKGVKPIVDSVAASTQKPREEVHQAVNDSLEKGQMEFDGKGGVRPKPPHGESFKEEPPQFWSTRHGDINQHLERLGLNTVDGIQRRELETNYKIARDKGYADNATEIATRMIESREGDSPQQPNREEAAGMALRATELVVEQEQIKERLKTLDPNTPEARELMSEFEDQGHEIELLSRASFDTLSEAGYVMRMSQTGLNLADLSLHEIYGREAGRKGRELDPQEREELRKAKEENEELKSKIFEMEQKAAQEMANQTIRDAKKAKRRKGTFANFEAENIEDARSRFGEHLKGCIGQ